MKLAAIFLAAAACVFAAEERTTEHKTFSGVRELVIDNVTGFIEVTASNGNAVEMDIDKTLSGDSADRVALAKKEISLNATQEGGLVRLYVDGPFRHGGGHEVYRFEYNFKVRVPRDVKLELHAVNHSHVTVDGTAGDYRISNVNGPIEMRDVSGSGSITTVNGSVKVLYAKNPTGATSFKTVNGSLDVSFRSGLNADVKMKTLNGGLYTDFDVTAMPIAGDPPENRNGKLVWRSRRMTGVRIGGGGPELQFETLNGDVMVRNREK